MEKVRRYPVLNIWVDAVDMRAALDLVADFVEKGERVHTVFASNPEKNFSVPKDRLLYEIFREADMLIPDGIGMVFAARILHKAKISRVPGCELMQKTCAMAAKKGYSVYLYGAREDVSARAAEILAERYPGIRIAGRSNGYVREEDMDGLVEDINASGARILFVALGSPRQEKWVSSFGGKLKNVRVCQGIGGTLDVIAGNVKRAPDMFCKTGIEWLYRLFAEPRRLKRQWVLPVFALRVVLRRLGLGQ